MMEQNQIHFEIFQFNYSNCIFFAESKFDPIFFRIVKNQKSAWLYDQEGEEYRTDSVKLLNLISLMRWNEIIAE